MKSLAFMMTNDTG